MVKQLWNTYDFGSYYVPRQFSDRGFTVQSDDQIKTEDDIFDVGSPSSSDGIPINYLYGRDAPPLWRIIRKFHESVINTFYHSDAEVSSDAQLIALVADVNQNGQLRGFPQLTTRAQLIDMITSFVFTATGFHATMNNQQFLLQGYVPARPHWMYGATPKQTDVFDERNLVSRIQHSSWQCGWETGVVRLLAVPTVHPITQFFGRYATDNVKHYAQFKKIADQLPLLQSRLARLQQSIETRNRVCNVCPPEKLKFAVFKPDLIGNSVEK